MNQIVLAKRRLREKINGLVKAYSEQARQEDSRKMLEFVKGQEIYERASRIAIFISMPQEIDTRPLIIDALSERKTVFVPKVQKKEMSMLSLQNAEEIDSFKKTPWGIPEPDIQGRSVFESHPAHDDLLIVPCVALNKNGRRVGHGGGYYDRYISFLNTIRSKMDMKPIYTLGIGLKCQIIDEEIPTTPDDIMIDKVVVL